tara:strand:- start:655 stop:834 length:180 start_codon:yes stop_codon:yes gene_type:complete
MKVGDLVYIIGSHQGTGVPTRLVGTIVAQWKVEEWWEVLTQSGQMIHWPESQIEVINEA